MSAEADNLRLIGAIELIHLTNINHKIGVIRGYSQWLPFSVGRIHVCTRVYTRVYTRVHCCTYVSHVFTFDNGESYAFDTARVIVMWRYMEKDLVYRTPKGWDVISLPVEPVGGYATVCFASDADTLSISTCVWRRVTQKVVNGSRANFPGRSTLDQGQMIDYISSVAAQAEGPRWLDYWQPYESSYRLT